MRCLSLSMVAATSAALLGACDDYTERAAGPVVRDSAGVRIVEYAGMPEVEPAFVFSPEPVYRHGGSTGDYAFGSIGLGRLFPDGAAALSDDATSEIVLLSPDGTEHSVLAKPGEGPGEVGYVTAMFTRGRDSLLVLDRSRSRLTLLVGGSLARTEPLVDLRRNTSLWPRGIDAAGKLLASTNSYRSGFEQAWLQGHMARFDLETGLADTVASYDFVPGEQNASPGFGRVTVADGQFVYTRSDRPEVRWILADGTLRQVVRWQQEWTYLTEKHMEPLVARLRASYRFANPQAPASRLEEMVMEDMARYEADLGEPLALFRAPFGDAEGRIWLPTNEPGGPREGVPPYSVVSSDGGWLGKVDAPPGLRILDVAAGRVLGVVKDEMDVESVVVYELISR